MVIGDCHSTCRGCKGPADTDCLGCSEFKTLVEGFCSDCSHPLDYFYLKGKECKELCGKGKIISDRIECDDGNTENGDGCDAECRVELDWICHKDEKG